MGEAQLPAGLVSGGIYMLVNTNAAANNGYVGISTDLRQRFSTRMGAVTELGFSRQVMDKIGVNWGKVKTRDTPNAASLYPAWADPGNYAAPLVSSLDGCRVNYERLVVRMMKMHWVPNDTIANNIFVNTPYVNPTTIDITVKVS